MSASETAVHRHLQKACLPISSAKNLKEVKLTVDLGDFVGVNQRLDLKRRSVPTLPSVSISLSRRCCVRANVDVI